MPVSALQRLKQDFQELEANLGYRTRPCLKGKYKNLKQQSKLAAPTLGKITGRTGIFQIQTSAWQPEEALGIEPGPCTHFTSRVSFLSGFPGDSQGHAGVWLLQLSPCTEYLLHIRPQNLLTNSSSAITLVCGLDWYLRVTMVPRFPQLSCLSVLVLPLPPTMPIRVSHLIAVSKFGV